MKKYILPVLVLVFVSGWGVYYQLGGFNQVKYSIEDRENIKLLGRTYRGTPQDEKMVETFREIEALIQNYPGADLHTVYYSEPAGKLDTLQVFVGIAYQEEIHQSENLERMTIPCTRVIVADIQAHRLVMAGPKRVKQGLEQFAAENNVDLQGVFVDRIKDKDEVEVIAPLILDSKKRDGGT